MTNKSLNNYIKDVKIESVKFLLQVSSPSDNSERQYNSIIGNFNFKDLDGSTISSTLGKELRMLNDLSASHDYANPFCTMIENWNEERKIIQSEGYGYGDHSNINRSKAYSYIFLLRILKRKHNKLHKAMKARLKTLKIMHP